MNAFEGLNENQKEAVKSTEGKIRVVAGAGSGKTKTLANRYAYLVENVGIDPANILCLTFTNKAAQEMRNRVAKMVSRGNYNDFICTIHGFCVKVLRKEIYRIGFPKSFLILDTEDAKTLAKQVIENCGIDRSEITIKQFLTNVHKSKGMGEYVEHYMLASSKFDEENNGFELYLKKQLKLFSLDFDDLINFTIYILNTFEDARIYWQSKFNYIMVDEAQDCSGSDWKIINTISSIFNNLFIVGDPDQAIYEWRGAFPSALLKFESDKDIILNENYRSTPNILDVANSLIENNKKRIKKTLITRNPSNKKVIHLHAKNEDEECTWIAKQIKKLLDKGASLSDIAILYRASYLSRPIEQALIKNNIKYTIWGGIRFFERKEIKDSLSYLRLVNQEDDLSFLRIANVPSRKIGKVFITKLRTLATYENKSLYQTLIEHRKDNDFHSQNVEDFLLLIENAKRLTLETSISELLEYLINNSGLKKLLRKDGDEERIENIEELMSSIKYYEEINKEENISLTSYLQDIALYTNEDFKKDTETIKLMTIHQSKGLEFPFVFIIGLSEGIFPSYRSIRERRKDAEEEERRLMYVAITRAKKLLFLTESEGYNLATHTDKYPSRFLLEIKRKYLMTEGKIEDDLLDGTLNLMEQLDKEINVSISNFEIGDKVVHAIFGVGNIIKLSPDKTSCEVKFNIGTRNLRTDVLKKQV